MNVLVVVPTYNERENIEILVPKVLGQECAHRISVLVVDDNSPDGTAGVVSRLMADASTTGRLFLLSRPKKHGLASGLRCRAYLGPRSRVRSVCRDGR